MQNHQETPLPPCTQCSITKRYLYLFACDAESSIDTRPHVDIRVSGHILYTPTYMQYSAYQKIAVFLRLFLYTLYRGTTGVRLLAFDSWSNIYRLVYTLYTLIYGYRYVYGYLWVTHVQSSWLVHI